MKPVRVLQLVLSSFALPAFAATFIVPEDKVLIEGADAVVVGVVQSSEASLTSDGGVYTTTEILVSEVLKGDGIPEGGIVRLREPGGRTERRSLILHGVPEYEPGERVLVMLDRDERAGMWRTHEYALGSFRFIRDDLGGEFLVRDRENICGWEPGFKPHVEQARKMEDFEHYVRDVVHGENALADYFVTFDSLCISGAEPAFISVHAPVTANAASDYLSLCDCRWNNGATASFETNGSQSGYTDSRGDAMVGMSPWNDHAESEISYTIGGTNGASQAFLNFDGINTILFQDPSNEVNGSKCFGGTGTIAVGGPWFGSQTHTFSSEVFKTIVGADLVVDCGVNPSNGISGTAFQAVLAHELGHTLGFRHSNEPSCAECDNATIALMASLINNGPGNASLLAWDKRAAAVAYKSTSTCTAVAITAQPASTTIMPGSSATLTVAVSGTSPISFQWFKGSSGNTSSSVSGATSASLKVTPSTTTSYWVRATNCNGSTADSSTATVTVNATGPCSSSGLCSLGRRFALNLAVRDHRTDKTGVGVPLQKNDLFGYFSLPDFTGSATNPEVFVKMLDGRNVNGRFWVFFGGLTDLEYTLTVRDTTDGTTKTYFKTGGTSNGGFDVGGGVADESCVGEVDGVSAGTEAPSVCGAATDRLCLNGARFRVQLQARDHRTGNVASGQSIPQEDFFGYFALPGLTGDPNNPEVFVKVVDGRAVNNFYWVFFSGLTDFEYTLTVVDTLTGKRKTYTKDPGSACGFFDTNAF